MSNIYPGLAVMARVGGTACDEHYGKIAEVQRIVDGKALYRYEHSGFEGRISLSRFWDRFEEIADVKPAGVAATAGHCAGNGGLRGHSVGDVFPVVVYQRGTPGFITHWLRLPDGRDIGPYHSYDDVHRAAAWHKAQL